MTKKMTRKRFCKLLMAHGVNRNTARGLAQCINVARRYDFIDGFTVKLFNGQKYQVDNVHSYREAYESTQRMGCRLSKSIIQAEKECYICRRWYAVKTTRGLEEHHVLNGPLRSFSERHGLKVWLCHQHHNEPGMSPHYNATCAQTLKAVAQAKYEEKNGPGAHAAWMAAVGKDYINA